MKYKTPRNFVRDYDWHYTPPDEILQAIGRIAVLCASIEELLHIIHWRYIDTLLEVAPILITGDMKPGRLMEDIVKIATVTGEEEPRIEDLKFLFADYRELSDKRNKCMHWIWDQPKKRNLKKHQLYPPSYKSGKSTVHFNVKELNRLGDDLIWVEARMRTHAFNEDDFEKERKSAGRHKRSVVPAPWLDR